MKPLPFLAALLTLAAPVFALDGQPAAHDPSTVIQCAGKFYVYATGQGIPISISDDGWTWRRAGTVLSSLPNGRPGDDVVQHSGGNTGASAWAPDIIKVGDNYFMYYALSGQNHRAVVALLTNKTLDPASPDYKWVDGGPIAWSDGVEQLHAIDPGVFHDPNDGSLWLVYGSYFGTIRLAQLDPATGKRLHPEQSQKDVANQSEASILIFHDGWYYLLTNHGTCCAGAASTYNIRVGRSKTVTGPFLDNTGVDMLRGGGKLFAASGDRKIGPGHFGLLDLGDTVQKFSCHYEADLDHGATSVLDIRPLLWRDGWPIAGDNVKEGTYQIMGRHSGTVLELAVPGVPVAAGRGRGAATGGGPGRGRGPGRGAAADPTTANAPAGAGPGPIAPLGQVAQVSPNWPAGPTEVRMAAYLLQAQQKWTLTPITGANAGGTPGSPYFKITVAGTDRTLAATDDDELIALPAFTGAEPELWRVDQLPDGSYRIAPKSPKNKLALTSLGRSAITLAPFSPDNENQRWQLNQP